MLQDADLISLQEVRTKVEKAWAAAQRFRAFSQEQVDAIVERMAEAARGHAQRLAEMAVEETGYGNAKDKLAKNMLAAERLPAELRGMKTVGVLRERPEEKVTELAVPVGVVAAILPTTNPTSTAIYKSLIALKAGNAIVLSPHPRAKGCTCATAEVLYRAAVSAGAPEGIIQCLSQPTMEATNDLMRHPRTAVILSTGGAGIVKAAYSSGKPAYGVGPGNVPVLLDTSADASMAVRGILAGKTFDNGTLCSSEQTIVAESKLRPSVLGALQAQGAFLCDSTQADALARVLFSRGTTVNPDLVGHSATEIAKKAGFSVPAGTRVLTAEIMGIGKDHPLSAEKLSPVLAVHFVENFDAALLACEAILRFHGLGHTCGIYTNDEGRALQYAQRMPAHRILVNTPTPQGSVGITTGLFPAMTLGCGSVAGNATGDNITPLHLLNVKRLAWAIRPWAGPEEGPALASGNTPVTRARIAAAVDRYLTGTRNPSASPQKTVANIVDRFLENKGIVQTCEPCAASRQTPEPKAPEPKTQPVTITDFVCEDDVRQAIRHNKKIYIGAKTIVTPSARELANGQRDEILVQT
ncbi:MAG TPA: aldehyde dehydrogenase family protein [Bryobacteraceae bacterium]|nr:aldehyde dehydrogenase family protein [Bryobacteraceae bacterium]